MKKIITLVLSLLFVCTLSTMFVSAYSLTEMDWEIGTIDSKNGELKDNDTRIRTVEYHKLSETEIIFRGGFNFDYTVLSYDADYKYIGTSNWQMAESYTSKFPNAEYIRVVVKFSDGRPIDKDNIGEIVEAIEIKIGEKNTQTTVETTAVDIPEVTTSDVTAPDVTTPQITTAVQTTEGTPKTDETAAVTGTPEATSENNVKSKGCGSSSVISFATLSVIAAATIAVRGRNKSRKA